MENRVYSLDEVSMMTQAQIEDSMPVVRLEGSVLDVFDRDGDRIIKLSESVPGPLAMRVVECVLATGRWGSYVDGMDGLDLNKFDDVIVQGRFARVVGGVYARVYMLNRCTYRLKNG